MRVKLNAIEYLAWNPEKSEPLRQPSLSSSTANAGGHVMQIKNCFQLC
jgi:hypothetical protein